MRLCLRCRQTQLYVFLEDNIKQTFSLKKLITVLTGLMFAVYAAYNVFVIIRGRSYLPAIGLVILAAVAVLFAILSAYLFTSLIVSDDIRFLMLRSTMYIVSLFFIFVLKLRMVVKVIDFFDVSHPETILYGCAYFFTLAAMVILFLYYTFFLRRLPLFPRAVVFLPLIALILFALSLIIEIILFFAYRMLLEDSVLRTVVIRPVFYLGFIGLSAHFLFPPEIVDE